uniref:Uncharacterized protein n=1 Tax=Alexandrium monilatum TaxID=311494 RepID=A0A7S4QMK0_9DINO
MGKSRGARGSTVIEPRKGYGGGYGRGAGADKNGNYGFGSTRQRGRSSSATPRPGGAVPPNKPASSQGPKEQPGDQEKPPTEERRRVDATPVSSRSQVQPAQPAQPVQQARVDEPSDGPPKPDRAAHDEARQRQLQESFLDPKEFDEKKAQLRAKLDTTSREIQQIQEKEKQEDEERRQVITEFNIEIEELEAARKDRDQNVKVQAIAQEYQELMGQMQEQWEMMRALRETKLPYPQSTSDVPQLLEQAEKLRGEQQQRLRQTRERSEELTKKKRDLNRGLVQVHVPQRRPNLAEAEQDHLLQQVAEAREKLYLAYVDAKEQVGPEALVRLALVGAKQEADERNEANMPLSILKDSLARAASGGISADRLAAALSLVAIVEREANEAQLGLAVDLLERLGKEAGRQPQDRMDIAKAMLKVTVRQAETAGVGERALERAREVLARSRVE